MADRVIGMADLALALASAASRPVAGAAVTELCLDLDVMVPPGSVGRELWSMRLRQPAAGRNLRWWWRSLVRHRQGWRAGRLSLRWTPAGLHAALDGREVGTVDPDQRPGGESE